MTQGGNTKTEALTHDQAVERAHALAPLFREKAREAEIARRPLDEVIDAVRDSGLFSMMVPQALGGHELDLDTFFEVTLILSKADASMGWLTAFYIEHNYWFLEFPRCVTDRLFDAAPYVLAPASLNVGAGKAERVDGGFRVSGRWQWGTGIVHGTWVMAGALAQDRDGNPTPYFFLLPREDVKPIDNWHIAGMSGTGSWDFEIDDIMVPEAYALPFIELMQGTAHIAHYEAPLYRTPLLPILGLTAATPQLGAAHMALETYCTQTKAKIAANETRVGMAPDAKSATIVEAALTIETAELLLRDVLGQVMEERDKCTMEDRGRWLARISHAVFMCRDAVHKIGGAAGASGNFLDNPIQRAVRDINTASCHVVFDRDSRYGDYGRLLFGQGLTNMLV